MTVSEPLIDAKTGVIARNNDDLLAKIAEYERNNIKIGAKIFLNHPNPNLLHEAIDSLFKILGINYLDNLILAYHPLNDTDSKTNGIEKSNGHQNGTLGSSLPNESPLTWGDTADSKTELKHLWQVLETYADDKQICQLGIADLDTDTLIDLYTSSRIKPIISQINLSACCVVPPSMQEFCAKNEIQLLTHSDSEGKNLILQFDFFFSFFLPAIFTNQICVCVFICSFLFIFSDHFKRIIQRIKQRSSSTILTDLGVTLSSAHKVSRCFNCPRIPIGSCT